MLRRCPDAVQIGSAVVKDYELLFRVTPDTSCGHDRAAQEAKASPSGSVDHERDERALDCTRLAEAVRKTQLPLTVRGRRRSPPWRTS